MGHDDFSSKLTLALKALSISRGRVAAELGVDKSAVARWLGGRVKPSDYNLGRLTALIAQHRAGFTALDWDRDPASFAEAFGAAGGGRKAGGRGLPLQLLDQFVALTERRGPAYEGFFRTTRPFPQMPGRFFHDHGMVRRDEMGLLGYRMGAGGIEFEGWLLPIQNQLLCITTDMTSGTMAFGIFHGVSQHRAEIIDGIILSTAMDAGRTINAKPVIVERLEGLSGDAEKDEARYRELISGNPLAPEGSISDDVRNHLSRNFGPDQIAQGGDWVLSLTLARSVARGPLLVDEP